jgi:serine protease Do
MIPFAVVSHPEDFPMARSFKSSLHSTGRLFILFFTVFGIISAGVFLFAPEKLNTISNSMAAFGAKDYKLPDPNGAPPVSGSDQAQLKSFSKVFANIGKATRPALVYIESKRFVEARRNPMEEFFFGGPFGNPRQGGGRERGVQQGAGSGFIVDLKNGYIVTNNHVVEGSNELRVQTFDNRSFKAKVVGAHKDTDVAVIKLEGFTPQELKQVTLANSDSVEVGDWVVALGAPFELPQTLTVGVVSALSRTDIMPEESSIQDFIQTDAAINPGNSGGPLLNIEGKVIGINTAIYSRTGSYSGIGFAVPANMVRTVAEELINEGKVSRGYLGINMGEIPSGVDIPVGTKGVFVAKILPKTPAEKAGLKPYDIIQSIDGTKVESPREVRRKVSLARPGTEITLGILRDGKQINVKLVLGDFDKETQQASQDDNKSASSELGIALQDLTPEIKKNMQIRAKAGAVVVGMQEGSPLDGLLEQGDVILEINRKNVRSVSDAQKQLNTAKEKGVDIVFLIERNGVNQLVVMRGR